MTLVLLSCLALPMSRLSFYAILFTPMTVMCCAHHISLIPSPIYVYMARSAHYEAPRYTVVSNLPPHPRYLRHPYVN